MDAIEQNIGDTNQHQVAGQPNEEGQVNFQFSFFFVFLTEFRIDDAIHGISHTKTCIFLSFFSFLCQQKPSAALNGDAAAFVPSESGDHSNQTYGTFTLKVPLDSKIWKTISASSASNHRITANRRSNPMPTVSTKLLTDLQINRSMMVDVKPDGLIRVRCSDSIL